MICHSVPLFLHVGDCVMILSYYLLMLLLNMIRFEILGCIYLKGKLIMATYRKISHPQRWEGNYQSREQNHNVRAHVTTASSVDAKTDNVT